LTYRKKPSKYCEKLVIVEGLISCRKIEERNQKQEEEWFGVRIKKIH